MGAVARDGQGDRRRRVLAVSRIGIQVRAMRIRHRTGCFVLLLYVFALPSAARGQSLRERFSDLFVFGSCGEALCLGTQFTPTGDALTEHGRHYLSNRVPRNEAMLLFLGDAVANVVGELPAVAMHGGGPGYIDADGNEVPISLGPIFAERAETLGAGRFFFGFDVSGFRVSQFNGVSADNLVANFSHEDSNVASDPLPSPGAPLWERDILQVRMNLEMDVVVATTALSVGLTNFIDVGVVLPVVRTRLSGSTEAQIIPLDPSHEHRFGGTAAAPILRATAAAEGSAVGVGDISARLKINLTGGTRSDRPPAGFGVAILGDVQFATGNEADLLGLGRSSGRLLAVFSGRSNGFSPHLNAGYLLREGDFTSDAVLATAGFDARVAGSVTAAVDLLTEWELDDPQFPIPGDIEFGEPAPLSFASTTIGERRTRIDLAVGLKFRVGSGMVLVTNALVPVRDVGLRSDVLWTLGLQGSFR